MTRNIVSLYPMGVGAPVWVRMMSEAVQCGYPSPAQDYEEDPVDLNALLVKDSAATFLVRTVGESMVGAGILDGDVVIVDRSQSPLVGDVVVAVLDGEFTIKRLVRQNGGWALQAENAKWPDVIVDELSELQVWGVVTTSLRFHRPPPR